MKISSDLFHRISQVLLLATLISLPVLYIPIPWIALSQTKMLIVGILTILTAIFWTIAVSMDGRLSLPKSLVLALAAVLPVAYIGSAIFSGSPYALAGSGVESDTAAAMVIWSSLLVAASVLLSSGKVLAFAYRAFLASVFVVELLQIIGFLFGSKIHLWSLVGPAASVVGSWHDLGILLVLAVILGVSTLEASFIRGKEKILTWVTVGLAFPLLIIVNVLDVWIALTAVSFMGAFYAWFIGWKSTSENDNGGTIPLRLTFGVFVTIFLVAITFSFLGNTISSVLPENGRNVQTEIRPTWEATALVANSVYRGGGLIFGSGPNTFDRQWGLYKPDWVNETAYWYADFVQGIGFVPTAFITVGLLGAIAWVVFLIVIVGSAARTVMSSVSKQGVWRFPTMALSVGVLYLWTMLVIYTPGPALIGLTFILTGALIALGRAQGIIPSISWEFARSKYGFAFILVPVVVVIGIGTASIGMVRALTADVLVNRSITIYNTSSNTSASQSSLNKALLIYPGYDRALRASVELNLVRFNSLLEQGTGDAAVRTQLQEVLQQAISGGLSAVSSDSNNYQNWLTLANAYQQLAGVQVEGAYDNAKKAYEEAIVINPSNPQPYLQLARLSGLQGDYEATRAYLNEALDKKSNYADAYYLLSQLEVSEGNMTEALAAAEKAVNAAPGESLLWYQYGSIAYQMGRYGDATQALGQAVALNANYANALYVLAYALNDSGRVQEAQIVFERVAALNPDNADVKAIVDALKSGETIPEFGR